MQRLLKEGCKLDLKLHWLANLSKGEILAGGAESVKLRIGAEAVAVVLTDPLLLPPHVLSVSFN